MTRGRIIRIYCKAILICLYIVSSVYGKEREAKPIGVIVPPVPDADPTIRTPLIFNLPTNYHFTETDSSYITRVDSNSFKDTVLSVGYKLITGIQCWEFRIEGEQRNLASWTIGNFFGGDKKARKKVEWFERAVNNEYKSDSIDYVVELVVSLFETDIPTQHMWSPRSGKYYNVLWADTIRTGTIHAPQK